MDGQDRLHAHFERVEAESARVMDNAQAWMASFIQADKEKTRLIEALLADTDNLKNMVLQANSHQAENDRLVMENERLAMNLESEMESRRSYQVKYKRLETESAQRNVAAQKLGEEINDASFIQVLVDGDGAKFSDSYLKDPVDGAPAAGRALIQSIRTYLEDDGEPGLAKLPIFARIYANFPGLARALRLSSVIDSDDNMALFAEHFTNNFAEFDFISVGRGKENADSKLRDMLGHYFNNVQCRKIFLACCHDNGYLHTLRKYVNREHRDKIVLLETTPAEPEFRRLGFPITRFDQVFKSDPLANETKRPSVPGTTTSRLPYQLASPPLSNGNAVPDAPQPSRYASTTPVSAKTDSSSPTTLASEPTPGPSTRSSSIVASANGGVSISYATAGGAVDHGNITVRPTKSKPPPKVVQYNADGSRIDDPIYHPSDTPAQYTYRDKLLAIKPNMLCNDHYLLGRCARPGCPKVHDASLSPQEVAIHRYKARTSVCPRGPECAEHACYLSHHCPHDPGCTRGSGCKFAKTEWGNLHLNTKEKLKPVVKWTEGQDFPTRIE